MDYSINNTLLTENEKRKLVDIANDKLIDVLTTFVNESSHTFYGEFKLNTFTNNLLSLNEKIMGLDATINDLNLKSFDELKSLAKEFNVENFETLDKESLYQAVQKAIYVERERLNTQSMYLIESHTNSSRNTFKHFFEDKIYKLKNAIKDDFNDEHKKQYTALIEDFSSLLKIVNKLQTWVDGITIPITLLNDYKEELESCDKQISDLKSVRISSFDPIEISNAKERMNQLVDKKQILKDSINEQKINILNFFKSNHMSVDFESVKDEFICKIMSHAIHNASYAFDNNIFNKEDFIAYEDGKEIDKCSRAFSSFFYEIIQAQYNYEEFLSNNEMNLSDNSKNKFDEITLEEEKVNSYEDKLDEETKDLINRIKEKESPETAEKLIENIIKYGPTYTAGLNNFYDPIHMMYDAVEYNEHTNGYIFVKKNDLWGVLDKDSNIVLDLQYETFIEAYNALQSKMDKASAIEVVNEEHVNEENNEQASELSSDTISHDEEDSERPLTPVNGSEPIITDEIPNIPLQPAEGDEQEISGSVPVDTVFDAPMPGENTVNNDVYNVPQIPLEPLNRVNSISEMPQDKYLGEKQKAKQAIENGKIFRKNTGYTDEQGGRTV